MKALKIITAMKTIYLKIFIMVFFLTIFLSCKKDNPVAYEEPVNIAFSLTLPPGWYLDIGQGIDSYIGQYYNANVKINFDFGILAFGSIDQIFKNKNTMYYEELMIDNCRAKIVKVQRQDGIVLAAYIDKEDGKHLTLLYSFDPKDDAALVKIFKTHKFK